MFALSRWFGRRVPPLRLRLYTRPGCHLCDEMKLALSRTRVTRSFELEEVDIGADAELTERFGRSIPVLEFQGRALFKGRLDPAEFERKFARLAAEQAAQERA
jgi:glutaredoxin